MQHVPAAIYIGDVELHHAGRRTGRLCHTRLSFRLRLPENPIEDPAFRALDYELYLERLCLHYGTRMWRLEGMVRTQC